MQWKTSRTREEFYAISRNKKQDEQEQQRLTAESVRLPAVQEANAVNYYPLPLTHPFDRNERTARPKKRAGVLRPRVPHSSTRLAANLTSSAAPSGRSVQSGGIPLTPMGPKSTVAALLFAPLGERQVGRAGDSFHRIRRRPPLVVIGTSSTPRCPPFRSGGPSERLVG